MKSDTHVSTTSLHVNANSSYKTDRIDAGGDIIESLQYAFNDRCPYMTTLRLFRFDKCVIKSLRRVFQFAEMNKSTPSYECVHQSHKTASKTMKIRTLRLHI